MCGIHDDVFAALLLYSDNLQVLEAGIGAVACLADVGKWLFVLHSSFAPSSKIYYYLLIKSF